MKKTIIALAAWSMMFAACNKTDAPVQSTTAKTITICASLEEPEGMNAETKASIYLDGNVLRSNWEENDKLLVYHHNTSSDTYDFAELSINPEDAGKRNARFTGTIDIDDPKEADPTLFIWAGDVARDTSFGDKFISRKLNTSANGLGNVNHLKQYFGGQCSLSNVEDVVLKRHSSAFKINMSFPETITNITYVSISSPSKSWRHYDTDWGYSTKAYMSGGNFYRVTMFTIQI